MIKTFIEEEEDKFWKLDNNYSIPIILKTNYENLTNVFKKGSSK